MGVIYEGYRYPTFWTEGYSTPTFQDEKVKNLLSPVVNRGDQQRLNYNKTIFGRGSTLDPAGRAHNGPDPELDEEDYTFSLLLPFRIGTQGRLVLLLNWYPHILD